MALEHDIAILSQAPLFHLLDRDALRLVAFAAEGRNLRAGDMLFQRGAASDAGYVVRAGTIALDPEDGSEPYVAGPGSLIGQAALFTTVERPATGIAQEPSSVMRIPPNLMRRVLEEFPSAAAAMQDLLAGDLAELTAGLERVRRSLVAIDGEE